VAQSINRIPSARSKGKHLQKKISQRSKKVSWKWQDELHWESEFKWKGTAYSANFTNWWGLGWKRGGHELKKSEDTFSILVFPQFLIKRVLRSRKAKYSRNSWTPNFIEVIVRKRWGSIWNWFFGDSNGKIYWKESCNWRRWRIKKPFFCLRF